MVRSLRIATIRSSISGGVRCRIRFGALERDAIAAASDNGHVPKAFCRFDDDLVVPVRHPVGDGRGPGGHSVVKDEALLDHRRKVEVWKNRRG